MRKHSKIKVVKYVALAFLGIILFPIGIYEVGYYMGFRKALKSENFKISQRVTSLLLPQSPEKEDNGGEIRV